MTHAPSMAAVAGFVWFWAATRDGRTTPAMGAARAARRAHGAHPLAEPALRAAAGVRRARHAGGRRPARRTARRATRVLAGGAVFALRGARVPAADARVAGDLRQLGSPARRSARRSAGRIRTWSTSSGRRATDCSARPRSSISAPSASSGSPSRGRAVGIPALRAVAVMIYFNACIQDWWGSAGFGGRRFDGTIPLFCVGLAAFDATRRRAHAPSPPRSSRPRRAARPVEPGADGRGAERPFRIGETLSFDAPGRASAGRPRLVRQSLHLSRQPVSRCATALSPGELRPAVDEPLPRRSASPVRPRGHRRRRRVADRGRLARARRKRARSRSAGPRRPRRCGSRSTMPTPLRVQVRLHAFAYPGAPAQTIAITVNGLTFGPVPVPDRWETLEFATGIDAWRGRVNRVRFDFARACARRPRWG